MVCKIAIDLAPSTVVAYLTSSLTCPEYEALMPKALAGAGLLAGNISVFAA